MTREDYYATKNRMQIKELVDIQNGEIIVLGGRPGMGKTFFALNQAEYFIKSTGKEVLYISSVPLCEYHKWTLNLMSNDVRAKLHICEEIYKFSSEAAFREKYHSILVNNRNINLVVIDCYVDFVEPHFYDTAFEFSDRLGVAVLCLAHIKRRVERRKTYIPKLNDIKAPNLLNAKRVFAVVRDNYYHQDGENILKLISLR